MFPGVLLYLVLYSCLAAFKKFVFLVCLLGVIGHEHGWGYCALVCVCVFMGGKGLCTIGDDGWDGLRELWRAVSGLADCSFTLLHYKKRRFCLGIIFIIASFFCSITHCFFYTPARLLFHTW